MSKWFVSPEQRGGGWAIESDTHGVVAVALQRDKHPMHGKEVTWKEAEEHARLIAAAPEMLEALKLAMEIGDGCSRGFLGEVQTKIQAAITKATGT